MKRAPASHGAPAPASTTHISRRRAAVVVAVIAVVALAACGRYTRRGSAPPGTTPEHVSVGADLDLADITTTTTPPTTAAGGGPRPTADSKPAQSPNPVTVTADGFELTLAVDGGTVHKADQPFTMSLVVRNVSGSDRHYDPNQRTYFVMQSGDGGGSWRDSDCAPGKASGEQARVIGAGEAITFTARYPGPADRLDNSDACRRPPRGYALLAGFVWCPPEALFGGVCDPSASRTVTSGSIGITLT